VPIIQPPISWVGQKRQVPVDLLHPDQLYQNISLQKRAKLTEELPFKNLSQPTITIAKKEQVAVIIPEPVAVVKDGLNTALKNGAHYEQIVRVDLNHTVVAPEPTVLLTQASVSEMHASVRENQKKIEALLEQLMRDTGIKDPRRH